MNQLIAETPIQNSTERLQHLYASMIGSAATAAWDEMDELWQQFETVEVKQDDVRGWLHRDNIVFGLGSLAGFIIQVKLETEDGLRQIQLGLNGSEPRFTIEPIVQIEPQLT